MASRSRTTLVANISFLVLLWPGGERGSIEGDAEPTGASELKRAFCRGPEEWSERHGVSQGSGAGRLTPGSSPGRPAHPPARWFQPGPQRGKSPLGSGEADSAADRRGTGLLLSTKSEVENFVNAIYLYYGRNKFLNTFCHMVYFFIFLWAVTVKLNQVFTHGSLTSLPEPACVLSWQRDHEHLEKLNTEMQRMEERLQEERMERVKLEVEMGREKDCNRVRRVCYLDVDAIFWYNIQICRHYGSEEKCNSIWL